MKILVTGANGYLGQGIVKKLLDKGVNVIATDIFVENIDERANIFKCNLFELENPYEYFDRPDQILHLAWKDGFIHNSITHITDFHRHYLFINKLVKSGIKKVAVMGTMHEIGFYEGEVNEFTPCNPMSFYGISKNALRSSLRVLCEENNIEFKWLRSYYIIGNSKFGSSVFSKLLDAEENQIKKFPFTSGQNKYDFLEYDDFINKVSHTILQHKINGIINICSGEPMKLADKVEEFIVNNKLNIKLEYGVYPDRKYDSRAIWGDNKKINEIMKDNYEKNYK